MNLRFWKSKDEDDRECKKHHFGKPIKQQDWKIVHSPWSPRMLTIKRKEQKRCQHSGCSEIKTEWNSFLSLEKKEFEELMEIAKEVKKDE